MRTGLDRYPPPTISGVARTKVATQRPKRIKESEELFQESRDSLLKFFLHIWPFLHHFLDLGYEMRCEKISFSVRSNSLTAVIAASFFCNSFTGIPCSKNGQAFPVSPAPNVFNLLQRIHHPFSRRTTVVRFQSLRGLVTNGNRCTVSLWVCFMLNT